jgi:hypothetical protein
VVPRFSSGPVRRSKAVTFYLPQEILVNQNVLVVFVFPEILRHNCPAPIRGRCHVEKPKPPTEVTSAMLAFPMSMPIPGVIEGPEVRLERDFRIDTTSNNYDKQPDDQFTKNFSPIESIATSTGQNDSGLFELNFRDERYLPFEVQGRSPPGASKCPRSACVRFRYDFRCNHLAQIHCT